MFFALTEDQQEFGAAVRGYLAERFDLAAVRGVVEDTDGDGNPAALWKAAGEQGWLAVTVPEEFDGLGLGLVEAQVIARALGAGVAPGPWRGTVLAAEAIRLAGSDEQKAAWLPRLATGAAVGALAARGTAPGLLPAVEYGAIADVVVAPTRRTLVTGASSTPRGSYDGTVRLADLTGGRPSRRCPARRPRSAPRSGPGPPCSSPPTWSASPARRSPAPSPTTATASSSACRSARSRRSSTTLADLHVAVTMAEHAALYAAHAVDAGSEDADAGRGRRQGQGGRRGAGRAPPR